MANKTTITRVLLGIAALAWWVYVGLEWYLMADKLDSDAASSPSSTPSTCASADKTVQTIFATLVTIMAIIMTAITWKNGISFQWALIGLMLSLFLLVQFGTSFAVLKDLGGSKHKKGIGAFHTWYGLALMGLTLIYFALAYRMHYFGYKALLPGAKTTTPVGAVKDFTTASFGSGRSSHQRYPHPIFPVLSRN
jgi:hypothetical protein